MSSPSKPKLALFPNPEDNAPTSSQPESPVAGSRGDSPVFGYDGNLMLDAAQQRMLQAEGSRSSIDRNTGSMRSPRGSMQSGASGRLRRTYSQQRREGAQSPTPSERSHTTMAPSLQGNFASQAHISKAAAAAQAEKHAYDAKFVEKDVDANFLCESHFYRGFFYLMRHTEHEIGASLREELFPQLTLALEAVLHQVVHEQLEREVKQRKVQQNIMGHHGASEAGGFTAAGKHKSWRQHPTYPTGTIRNPSVHPVILLAQELKKRSRAARTKQSTPPPSQATSSVPPPDLHLDPASESVVLVDDRSDDESD